MGSKDKVVGNCILAAGKGGSNSSTALFDAVHYSKMQILPGRVSLFFEEFKATKYSTSAHRRAWGLPEVKQYDGGGNGEGDESGDGAQERLPRRVISACTGTRKNMIDTQRCSDD